MQQLIALFSAPFFLRALLVGTMVALCAALLGVSLVLKRYSMIGDGLSHVGFGAVAVAMATGTSPLAVSIPVVIVAAFLLLRLSERSSIKGDAAIAIVSSGAFAIGVIVVSKTTGMNADAQGYLFGSILFMDPADVWVSVAVSAVVLVLFIAFSHRIFAVTFDEPFARATGVRVELYNTLLALLTALTIVIGMRIMGAMLISSLIIFPALSAMRLFGSFRSVIVCSGAVSVVCLLGGMCAAALFNTPAGASIVVANLAVFLLFSLAGRLTGRAA